MIPPSEQIRFSSPLVCEKTFGHFGAPVGSRPFPVFRCCPLSSPSDSFDGPLFVVSRNSVLKVPFLPAGFFSSSRAGSFSACMAAGRSVFRDRLFLSPSLKALSQDRYDFFFHLAFLLWARPWKDDQQKETSPLVPSPTSPFLPSPRAEARFFLIAFGESFLFPFFGRRAQSPFLFFSRRQRPSLFFFSAGGEAGFRSPSPQREAKASSS